MYIAHGLMHRRSQDFGLGGGPNCKLHAITSSEIFKKRDFLRDKKEKISSWGSTLASNKDFAEGEGLEPQVKKFYKYIKIGRRGKQISATQTNFRQGLGPKPPVTKRYGGLGAKPQPLGDFLKFLEKIAILIGFGSHFARF